MTGPDSYSGTGKSSANYSFLLIVNRRQTSFYFRFLFSPQLSLQINGITQMLTLTCERKDASLTVSLRERFSLCLWEGT